MSVQESSSSLYRKADFPDAPERVSLDMLQHRDLIRLAGSGSVGTLFSSEVDRNEPRSASISVQTYCVAAALVRRGAGFAVVDEFTARASLNDDLDFRPLAESAGFSVYCIHLEVRPLSRIAREFVTVLKSALEGAVIAPVYRALLPLSLESASLVT